MRCLPRFPKTARNVARARGEVNADAALRRVRVGRNGADHVDQHAVGIARDEVALPESLVAERLDDRKARRGQPVMHRVDVRDLEIQDHA
jgi:hypothetical protein